MFENLRFLGYKFSYLTIDENQNAKFIKVEQKKFEISETSKFSTWATVMANFQPTGKRRMTRCNML